MKKYDYVHIKVNNHISTWEVNKTSPVGYDSLIVVLYKVYLLINEYGIGTTITKNKLFISYKYPKERRHII